MIITTKKIFSAIDPPELKKFLPWRDLRYQYLQEQRIKQKHLEKVQMVPRKQSTIDEYG
jgi:hypothetical protein